MKTYLPIQQQKVRKGVALIASLWVVTILIAVLITTLTLIKSNIDANIESAHLARAWQHAHSGLSFGSYPNIQRDDPLLRQKSAEFGDGFDVSITAEASSLNINKVLERQDRNLLQNLFKSWGLEDSQSDALVGALLDWVDGDELLSLNGAEREDYESLGLHDRPYNRPFSNLDELSLVLGFHLVEEAQPQWRKYFTLYSEGVLDIYQAHPELVSVAAEVGMSEVEDMQNLAKGEDGILETDDDQKYGSLEDALNAIISPVERREVIRSRFTEKGQILRVESVGFSGIYALRIKAVLGGSSGILHYEEEKVSRE